MIVAVSGKQKGDRESGVQYSGTQVIRHIGRKKRTKQIQHNAEPLPPSILILPSDSSLTPGDREPVYVPPISLTGNSELETWNLELRLVPGALPHDPEREIGRRGCNEAIM